MHRKQLFSILRGFSPENQNCSLHKNEKKTNFFFCCCTDKMRQTHDSECFRTERGVEVLGYFLLCYKQPFLPPALDKRNMSGTFSRVTKKGTVCLVADLPLLQERNILSNGSMMKVKVVKLLGLSMLFCAHFSFISVQIK